MDTNQSGSIDDPKDENQSGSIQDSKDENQSADAKKGKGDKPEKSHKPPKAEKALSANTFKHDGKTYKVLIPKMNIPEIGLRTALEVCADPDAQKVLIDCNCIGSVLAEVVE